MQHHPGQGFLGMFMRWLEPQEAIRRRGGPSSDALISKPGPSVGAEDHSPCGFSPPLLEATLEGPPVPGRRRDSWLQPLEQFAMNAPTGHHGRSPKKQRPGRLKRVRTRTPPSHRLHRRLRSRMHLTLPLSASRGAAVALEKGRAAGGIAYGLSQIWLPFLDTYRTMCLTLQCRVSSELVRNPRAEPALAAWYPTSEPRKSG
jgi:hypothetical protein